MSQLLAYDFLRRALVAAILVGIAAPAVGTFIVQRQLSLLGDGIGHIALTGVGLGLLTRGSPTIYALIVSALGAIAIEIVRARTRTAGDVALAVLFYGGLAGGVLFANLSGGSAALNSYLFGSIGNVSTGDLYIVAGLAVAVLGILALFGRELFALCQDEEVARASGLPVRFLSLLIAVTAALTVVIAMRAVGLLLVSALMVVPVAAAEQIARGFKATIAMAVVVGVVASVGGLWASVDADLAPGPTIVLITLVIFLAAIAFGRLLRMRRTDVG